ncbi:MAG: pyruvate, phosphate dikinase [Deltaproteobacteria bacterium RIFCSPHIGHO2_02_FULL_60_17]|nr:MAG: pyruvate, phosphate dikinase [Deltaproteobacteria bacterium RIFCSPHIGHO2_02_FULL_60_17]
MAKARKFVYSFGAGKAEGKASMRGLLGGKGAGLHEMTRIGVPVPPGFTITTEVCTHYYKHRRQYPKGLERDVLKALSRIEKIIGRGFGDPLNPLLVSVRSGARASMPGMMDTVLNLGLNDRTVQGLVAQMQDPRSAYDCYRRFVQMYGDVVLGLKPREKEERDPFEVILERKKKARRVRFDTELSADDLKELVAEFKAEIKAKLGKEFPEEPQEQLWGAIGAVFGSWNNDRAIAYRQLYHIPHNWGTAVNVQTMVFGNMGERCATGVVFTRNSATGEKRFNGEFLVNAQGEDVVAGTRTPRPIAELKEVMPKGYRELEQICGILEKHYKEMQDTEFTIENDRLWLLQTRAGKRTGFAAVRIAMDMVEERIISKEQALLRIEPDQLNQLLRPIFDQEDKERAAKEGRILARGLPAGPGAAAGRIVFHAEDAEAWKKRGERVILCRVETSPDDIRGMDAAQGILTARGGMTSHAALVARQMGKICVVGCEAVNIDYAGREMHIDGSVLKEGDWISVDGGTGEVIKGELKTLPSEVLQVLIGRTLEPKASRIYQQFARLMKWADGTRKIGVRTNTDQPDQARVAMAFGAEGIGLCRTEHMFFEGKRIDAVREMILAEDEAGRRRALKKLLPMQKEDFKGILEIMGSLPVTIRTLDPPLHEFLPKTEAEIVELARIMSIPIETLKNKVDVLHEFNPMLGHRGCRLAISYPEITEMQAQAIFEAACELRLEGKNPFPEVMIPLVSSRQELHAQREIVERAARDAMKRYGVRVRYLIGTMIELPRACLVADEIAQEAEFFSFGTNDLTQTCLGLSRDDAGKFLPSYVLHGILPEDPFVSIDRDGVGALMRLGVQKGRKVRRDLEIGICGEHGGDPKSVAFCHEIGLDYVSCSAYRVPIAKLAAAQAALRRRSRQNL